MGLSGRKVKQRIGNDPRNLSWANDAARFGSNYLAKFGWDPSQGLGVNGEGRTSHIKATQKLDMMGIGAAHQKDPNGIAWKQNKDFESLLKRLNEGVVTEEEVGTTVDGFVKPKEESEEAKEDQERRVKEKKKKDKAEGEGEGGKEKGDKTKGKKVKMKRDETKDQKVKAKKDEREEKEDKKEKRKDRETNKRKRAEDDKDSHKKKKESLRTESPSTRPEPIEPRTVRRVPRHRSHRARHIAAKSLALKSANAISEILGIAPVPSGSSSMPPSGYQIAQEGKLTCIYDEDDGDGEKITTSSKSLQDYFQEKLMVARGRKERGADDDGYEEGGRRGLGW